jgi:hypothetical protein
MELLQLPEPYRTDWRFSILIATVGAWLGVKPAPKAGEVYKNMQKVFDSTSQESHQDSLEANIKATFAGLAHVFEQRRNR